MERHDSTALRGMLARMLWEARRELRNPTGDWENYVEMGGGALRIAERMDDSKTRLQVHEIDMMLWNLEEAFLEHPESAVAQGMFDAMHSGVPHDFDN